MDKLNCTSEELLNKKFSTSVNGYNPLEVDEYLDKIIRDYEAFEKGLSVSNDSLFEQIKALKDENAKLKADLENEKGKWKYISKDHKNIHIDNYELLLRIGKLEKIIYEKLNMNPDEIK